MNETKLYKAFGLIIESCFPIVQVPEIAEGEPDVRIVRSDLSGLTAEQRRGTSENANYFSIRGHGAFRITNGCLIEADPAPNFSMSKIGVYLMGSCMGAILHQRGIMPLHGSCVTDGSRSILITGDSGAGKSTLAAEFLKQGWKLITDDVTAVSQVDSVPMAQSSYPSQKLWQDSLDQYGSEAHSIHSLYTRKDREKYGVNVASSFFGGTCPLSMVVRLIAADAECSIEPMEGITKVDQLLRNTYRPQFIEPRNQQRHFQRCVTLSTKVPMALVTRENGKQCADTLYNMITDYLGGLNHE